MTRTYLIAALFALAGCAQLPPSPEEIQSKKFESLPDKAVIYIVRNEMDSHEAGMLLLDDLTPLKTYRSTFFRWEVAPGPHRIAGFAGDSSSLNLDAKAGAVYYVEYTVIGTPWTGWSYTRLRSIDEPLGRRLVQGAGLLLL
jgi:hypothetical protein